MNQCPDCTRVYSVCGLCRKMFDDAMKVAQWPEWKREMCVEVSEPPQTDFRWTESKFKARKAIREYTAETDFS